MAGAARPEYARRGRAGILSRRAVRVRAARCDQAGGRAVHARRRRLSRRRVAAHRQSIAAIRSGSCSTRIVANDKGDKVGWYWQLQNLPDAPETRYLYHLLASHEFQEGLKNYRDLQLMQRNLATWSLSVAAFEDMVDTRRRAYRAARAEVCSRRSTRSISMRCRTSGTSSNRASTAIERDNDVAGARPLRASGSSGSKVERSRRCWRRRSERSAGAGDAREDAAAARHAAVGFQLELQGARCGARARSCGARCRLQGEERRWVLRRAGARGLSRRAPRNSRHACAESAAAHRGAERATCRGGAGAEASIWPRSP